MIVRWRRNRTMPVWPKTEQSIKKPALRRQCGNAVRKRPVTIPVQCKILMPLENLKTTGPVVAVRPERGYSATKYDASATQPHDANSAKSTMSKKFVTFGQQAVKS